MRACAPGSACARHLPRQGKFVSVATRQSTRKRKREREGAGGASEGRRICRLPSTPPSDTRYHSKSTTRGIVSKSPPCARPCVGDVCLQHISVQRQLALADRRLRLLGPGGRDCTKARRCHDRCGNGNELEQPRRPYNKTTLQISRQTICCGPQTTTPTASAAPPEPARAVLPWLTRCPNKRMASETR